MESCTRCLQEGIAYCREKIDIKAIADSVSDALAYASLSKSKKIKELASEINHILTRKKLI